MSKMSDLDVSIEEFVRGDERLRSQIIEDINAFWDGVIRFPEMCWEAQCIWEAYETGQMEEIHGSAQVMRDLNTNDDDQFISMEE